LHMNATMVRYTNHMANSAVIATTTNGREPLAMSKFRETALDAVLLASVCVITKPSNSKLEAPLPAEEAELCPSVVTTTVCNASFRLGALQLNPHDAVCELLKLSTTACVD